MKLNFIGKTEKNSNYKIIRYTDYWGDETYKLYKRKTIEVDLDFSFKLFCLAILPHLASISILISALIVFFIAGKLTVAIIGLLLSLNLLYFMYWRIIGVEYGGKLLDFINQNGFKNFKWEFVSSHPTLDTAINELTRNQSNNINQETYYF